MLNAPRSGLQPEIDAFLHHALALPPDLTLGKSAICQARAQLHPRALRDLLVHSAASLSRHSSVPLWRGRRVVALDSSTLRVPDDPECVAHFGGMNTSCGKFRPIARCSALLDVARGAFIDAVLGGYAKDDRSLAFQHLDHLTPDDLLLMDRGYPSRKWLGQLNDRNIAFCARIGHPWAQVKQFLHGQSDDSGVDLGSSDKPLRLRLLRAVLPNGSILVLVTNLADPLLTPADFAGLYHGRWRIEEAFKLIKARLQVENWSGLLPHTVEQDFFASLVRANCAAACALAARPQDATLEPSVEPSGWYVKINKTLVIKSLRHFLPRLLLGMNPAPLLDAILVRLRSPNALERTRPQRSAHRNKGVRLAGFHPAYKSA